MKERKKGERDGPRDSTRSPWRGILPACLLAVILIETVSGLFLLFHYSPSAVTAWESTWLLQNRIPGGQFMRSLHHYTTDFSIILIFVWLLKVAVVTWKRAPRRAYLWSGLAAGVFILALTRTGEVLPWDQNAYHGAKIVSNLAGSAPLAGDFLQALAIGGSEPGHLTLTRMSALHCFALPLLFFMIGALVWAKVGNGRTESRFRDFVRRNLPAAGVTVVVIGLALGIISAFNSAPLGSPANPGAPFPAARPSWRFLSLFELLRHVPVAVGTYVLPTLALVGLAALPRLAVTPAKRRVGTLFVGGLLLGSGALALTSIRRDRSDESFQVEMTEEEQKTVRINELIALSGIPPTGAADLANHDPFLRGPQLFAERCSGCHRHADVPDSLNDEPPSAPELTRFADRTWASAIFDQEKFKSPAFFGNTKFKEGKMAKKVLPKLAKASPGDLHDLALALSAEAALPYQRTVDEGDAGAIEHGQSLLINDFGCIDCHAFHDEIDPEDATAPDLTGYGSAEWIVAFIAHPDSDRFYGKKNEDMPSFRKEGTLSQKEITLLTAWLRREWPGAEGVPPDSAFLATINQATSIPTP